MAFRIEGKEMYPIFVFAKCYWLVHSSVKFAPKTCMRTANREATSTISAV